MNTFENFYNRISDAKTAYNAAKTEDEKNTARAAYKAVWDELKELGNAACRLFKEYETSKDSGNEHLDISEVVWDKDVSDLITAMRENGIEHFDPQGKSTGTDLIDRVYSPTGYLLSAAMLEPTGAKSLIDFEYDESNRLIKRTLINTKENILDSITGNFKFSKERVANLCRNYGLGKNEFYTVAAALAIAKYNNAQNVMLSWVWNGREDVEWEIKDVLLDTVAHTSAGDVKLRDLRPEIFLMRYGLVESEAQFRETDKQYYYYNK